MTTDSEDDVRGGMTSICHRLYEKDMVPANGGNVSARLADNEVLISPTGESLADAEPGWFVKVDLQGRKLSGGLNPSCEVSTHTRIYRERPEVGGIIHAHPPFCTAMALAGCKFGPPSHPEAYVWVGEVKWIDYATPAELADRVSAELADCGAFLLANHGALTVGATLKRAHFRLESLEMHARASTFALLLGGVNPLPEEAVAGLDALRRELGLG